MFEGAHELTIDVERKADGVYLVRLGGRLDSDTYARLDEKTQSLLSPSTRVIIFDMEQVNYVSSAGLGVIFQIKKVVEGYNGSFIIASLQPHVKKVFDIVKALPRDNIFESVEEIDNYLDTIQRREIKRRMEGEEEEG